MRSKKQTDILLSLYFVYKYIDFSYKNLTSFIVFWKYIEAEIVQSNHTRLENKFHDYLKVTSL